MIPDTRASGCFQAPKKSPHEMGSKKGNVKIRRKVGRPQIIEKIGSSGWIRTSNPPVNRSDPEDRPSAMNDDEDDETQ